MTFHSILIETKLKDHPRAKWILSQFPNLPVYEIHDYESWWARVQKPYLSKRTKLNIVLAKKRGELIKMAPSAYGLSGELHYYFVHAYNCIYECEYCYLQGYFRNPDLVLFLNHEEVIQAMQVVLDQNPLRGRVWFHAGEFSDSLALSHLSQELPLYRQFVEDNPRAVIELRTKSVNIKEVLKLSPSSRWVVSFSISPSSVAKALDRGTPSVSSRIQALCELRERGHHIALHFDPIVHTAQYLEQYAELIEDLHRREILSSLDYISLGVVRFSKGSYRKMSEHYPDSLIHQGLLVKEGRDKVKYTPALRAKILSSIEQLLTAKGVAQERIYWCME